MGELSGMSPTTEKTLKRYGVSADLVLGFDRVDSREIRAGEILCIEREETPLSIYPEPCARLTCKGRYEEVSI